MRRHSTAAGGNVRDAFTILVICSANICRSPLAQVLLQEWADRDGLGHDVVIGSAGTDAFPGDPMCGHAADHARVNPFAHATRELEPAMLIDADLILAAERSQRGHVARMLPSSRPRLFTLRQAGMLGTTLAATFEDGRTPEGAPPLPVDSVERLRWLVRELDAGRGLLAGSPEPDADIADLHGPGPHDDVFRQVAAAVSSLTASFTACLQAA